MTASSDGHTEFSLELINIDIYAHERYNLTVQTIYLQTIVYKMREKFMRIPKNFRGLIYAPNTESELGILFGMLLPYLEPPMCVVEGEFQVSDKSWPDIKVKILQSKRWQSSRVEFEVKSATFVHHAHNPKDYDKIVCWQDNWQSLPPQSKRKYRKFEIPGSIISLKAFLENNPSLNITEFVLNREVGSKGLYKKPFSVINKALGAMPGIDKKVAKDYVSYFHNGISFIQLRPQSHAVAVYISKRALDDFDKTGSSLDKLRAAFDIKISEKQKDISFSLISQEEARFFMEILAKAQRR